MQGVTQKALMEELPDIPLEELAPALNVLLSRHQLQIYTQGSTLYYKPVNQVRLRSLVPMSSRHVVVKLFGRFVLEGRHQQHQHCQDAICKPLN
jgi:hypothetical protein